MERKLTLRDFGHEIIKKDLHLGMEPDGRACRARHGTVAQGRVGGAVTTPPRPMLSLTALRLLVERPHSPLELGAALGLQRRSTERLLAQLRETGVEVEQTQDAADARRVTLSVSRAAALRALGLK